MYVVYRISGPYTNSVYYGYTQAEDIKAKFLSNACIENPDYKDRGDVRWLQSNDNDIDSIKVEMIDVFDEEVEAFIERNVHRVTDPDSITSSCNYPGTMFARAAQLHPEKMQEIKKIADINAAKTAREAWRLGKWGNDQIKSLTAYHKRDKIVSDLDVLTPNDFEKKYMV